MNKLNTCNECGKIAYHNIHPVSICDDCYDKVIKKYNIVCGKEAYQQKKRQLNKSPLKGMIE